MFNEMCFCVSLGIDFVFFICFIILFRKGFEWSLWVLVFRIGIKFLFWEFRKVLFSILR